MIKINKKGITSVELLVSFIVVSVVIVGMFSMIMNYKNKEQVEEINNEVITYSNNIQKIINDTFIKEKLSAASITSSNLKQANFTLDGSNTTLIIKPSDGIISYGYIGNEIIDYEIPNIPDLTLGEESKIEYIDGVNPWIKITIVLHHPNFENETYMFTITSPIGYH